MRTLFIVASALILSACGGAPTGPAPVPPPSGVVTSTTPPPAPPVEEPAPVPTPAPAPPPAPPVPVPVPPPAPPPPRGETFTAEVGFAYWYGPAVFLGHFEVTVTPVRIEAGAHGFDILARTDSSVLAGTRNVETLSIEWRPDGTGSWIYNGLAGQAAGGLRVK